MIKFSLAPISDSTNLNPARFDPSNWRFEMLLWLCMRRNTAMNRRMSSVLWFKCHILQCACAQSPLIRNRMCACVLWCYHNESTGMYLYQYPLVTVLQLVATFTASIPYMIVWLFLYLYFHEFISHWWFKWVEASNFSMPSLNVPPMRWITFNSLQLKYKFCTR